MLVIYSLILLFVFLPTIYFSWTKTIIFMCNKDPNALLP